VLNISLFLYGRDRDSSIWGDRRNRERERTGVKRFPKTTKYNQVRNAVTRKKKGGKKLTGNRYGEGYSFTLKTQVIEKERKISWKKGKEARKVMNHGADRNKNQPN